MHFLCIANAKHTAPSHLSSLRRDSEPRPSLRATGRDEGRHGKLKQLTRSTLYSAA
jgi:hypothetical protein